MGRAIRPTRKGARTRGKRHRGLATFKSSKNAERFGYIRGLVKAIIHAPNCGTPLAVVHYRDPYRKKLRKEVFAALDGMRVGQYLKLHSAYRKYKARRNIGKASDANAEAARRIALLAARHERMMRGAKGDSNEK